MLNDRRQAWDMQADGSYVQRQPPDPKADVGTHQTLMNLARQTATPAGTEPRPAGR
jgi:polyphosphate kinase